MAKTTRKRRTQKKKRIDETEDKQCETQNLGNGVDADLQEDAELQDDAGLQDDANLQEDANDDEDNEDNLVEPVGDDAAADNEAHTPNVAENVADPKRKRKQGQTKMKNIAKDPNEKIHVDYTIMGEPCGPGSIPFASYLGTIVREHVPYTIRDWRKVSEDIKLVLWKSIEARFDLDQPWKKTAAFGQMRDIWRSSKSRLVSAVRAAENLKDRMDLRPPNITEPEWRKFIKEKTSNAFKIVSDSMKKKRMLQIPHCLGRKGMVRKREELIKASSDPSQVTRAKVWVESRTKKDGTPVNTEAAEMIRKAAELEIEGTQDSATTNPKEDILSQILGPDNPGRLRAMGRGMSLTKLSCFQVNISSMAAMEADHVQMKNRIQDLEQIIEKIYDQRQEGDVGENSTHKSVNTKTLPKCNLVDLTSDDNVAEARIVSYDADELVHGIPLGPNAVKVFIESATKPEAPLWRPIPEMTTIEDVVGEMIAWDADLCIVPSESGIADDIAPKSPSTSSKNRCKLKALGKNDEVVAEGRWQSQDAKALVNGLPIGPNAIKVYVDAVLNPQTWLWRPTADMRTLQESLNCFIAWPANRVVIDTTSNESPVLQQSTSKGGSIRSHNEKSPKVLKRLAFKENQKCKLMDISGKNRVVAEGRWSTSDPDQVVHHVKLGPNACRVWVNTVIDKDAAVWRQTPEIQYMADAHGTCLAWPEDKIVMVNEDK